MTACRNQGMALPAKPCGFHHEGDCDPLTKQELRALALLLVERHVRIDFPICDVLAWENVPELSEADHRRLGDAADWVSDQLSVLRRRYEQRHDIDAQQTLERVS